MLTPQDIDKRQQVEGFATLLSDPNRYTFGGKGMGPDFAA